MHGRKYEHATVLEDLQYDIELEATGGPVGLEDYLEQLYVVQSEVPIQGKKVISIKVRLVYRGLGDYCIHSV